MVTIANKRAIKAFVAPLAVGLCTLVRGVWLVLNVLVLASTSQDPSSLGKNVEELLTLTGLACLLCCTLQCLSIVLFQPVPTHAPAFIANLVGKGQGGSDIVECDTTAKCTLQ